MSASFYPGLAGLLPRLWGGMPTGWTRRSGTYFVKLSYSFFGSDDYYNIDGELLNTATFRQESFNLYGEYGITDRLTAIVQMPLIRWNGFETTETVSGIGDLRVELKYALLQNKFPLAISIAPEFPTGPNDLFAQNETNSFEEINLPTGDGEFNVWTTLAGSTAHPSLPLYASASVAYNFRTEYNDVDFQDQLKFAVEIGYQPITGLWVNGTINTQTSLGEENPVVDFVRGDGTAYTAWGFGVSYEFIEHFSLSANYWNFADFIFERKNIYSAPTLSLGIYHEIK